MANLLYLIPMAAMLLLFVNNDDAFGHLELDNHPLVSQGFVTHNQHLDHGTIIEVTREIFGYEERILENIWNNDLSIYSPEERYEMYTDLLHNPESPLYIQPPNTQHGGVKTGDELNSLGISHNMILKSGQEKWVAAAEIADLHYHKPQPRQTSANTETYVAPLGPGGNGYDGVPLWLHSPSEGDKAFLYQDPNRAYDKAIERYYRETNEPRDTSTPEEFKQQYDDRYAPQQGSNVQETPYGKIKVNNVDPITVDVDIYVSADQIPDTTNADDLDGNLVVGDGMKIIQNSDIPDIHPVPVEPTEAEKSTYQKFKEDLKRYLDKIKEYSEIDFLDDLIDYLIDVMGDPIVFSLDENIEACTIKREMGNHDSTYWKMNFFESNPPIQINMERELCEGSYMFGIDLDGSGELDTQKEILYHITLNAYQALGSIDYHHGVFDGVFDSEDELWAKALVMDSDRNYYTPEELGIIGVAYVGNMKAYHNDIHGKGVYADNVGVSGEHFRIMAFCKTCIVLESGEFVNSYGTIQAPLQDCTVNDARYHIAEKHTGEYLRIENTEDPTYMYEEALDYCDDFEAAHINPDKYLSHWIAGIASMEHKKGIETGVSDMEWLNKSKISYEKALAMSPDNPFYNVDYCILHYHMGMDTSECIDGMDKAIEDRPDVEWFVEARMIAERGNQ